MKIIKSIAVLAVLLMVSLQICAQSKPVIAATKIAVIDDKKMPVYLEFVKTGVCYNGNYFSVINVNPCQEKSDGDEKFEAVWVRFVNNTSWAVMLDVQKLSPAIKGVKLSNGLETSAAKDGSEIDVIYDIESETGCDFNEEAPKGETCKRRETLVPEFYRRGSGSSSVFVLSGQSVIFAIRRDHLKKYLTTYVLFNYEWEMSSRMDLPPPRYEMQHRVYFSWYDAEQGVKKESEKKAK